jgi:hypothetical protein
VAAPAGHRCEDHPGTGHYLRVPEVPVTGWYWREPDGSLTRTTGKFGRPRALAQAADLIDQAREQVQAARIALAQRRDDLLTEAELLAMLDVYEEFGR